VKLFPPAELRPEFEPVFRLALDPWLPPELELRPLLELNVWLLPELELCDE
jgi:hypothetical protein